MKVYEPVNSPLLALAQKIVREGIQTEVPWWNKAAWCVFCFQEIRPPDGPHDCAKRELERLP